MHPPAAPSEPGKDLTVVVPDELCSSRSDHLDRKIETMTESEFRLFIPPAYVAYSFKRHWQIVTVTTVTLLLLVVVSQQT